MKCNPCKQCGNNNILVVPHRDNETITVRCDRCNSSVKYRDEKKYAGIDDRDLLKKAVELWNANNFVNPCERCGSTEIMAELNKEKVYCCNCNSTVYCSPELSKAGYIEEWNAHNPVKNRYKFNPCKKCKHTDILLRPVESDLMCSYCGNKAIYNGDMSFEETWNAANPIKEKQYHAIYKCRMCGEKESLQNVSSASDAYQTVTSDTVLHTCKSGDIGCADFIGWRLS